MRRVWIFGAVLALMGLGLSGVGLGTSAARGGGAARPRAGAAMGVVPPVGQPEIATGQAVRVVYHGGPVMGAVTIHTVFWAPRGYHFLAPPPRASTGYQALIQRFFTDVAGDSGRPTNVFSVLTQYPGSDGPGRYRIRYSPAADSLDDTDPYPARRGQCASPSGIVTCVTDLQLEHELDGVIARRDPAARGLHNLWLVFLPPNVDTCVSPRDCGTTTFGGYHAQMNLGHGLTIYANMPDPLIEVVAGPGSDPQGNPDAEAALGVAAEETVEAITDPTGTGWMDPNGSEVVDKCDSGPQAVTPLGFAPDGAPFDQLIGGDEFLLQTMWSNADGGCVQRTSATRSALPLPRINLTQFSPRVSGSLGVGRPGVLVNLTLMRAGTAVARAQARTDARGSWGPVALRAIGSRGVHGVGDDRETLMVSYGKHLRPDLIRTGNGGNPFTQAGWTGWFDLDYGFAIHSSAGRGRILLGPCSQTGVLSVSLSGAPALSPGDFCGTESDVSTVGTGALGPGTSIHLSSIDNRAVSAGNADGALVRLTVALGEPNSVSVLGNDELPFDPTGFPVCVADLQAQQISCGGLVPGAEYTLERRRGLSAIGAIAGADGVLHAGGFAGRRALTGGDVVRLRNRAGRILSVLHVAHLRVRIDGRQSVLAAGRCQPGDYYGRPLLVPPVATSVFTQGVSGTGTICPLDGNAAGLPARRIEQSDDLSGGLTITEVPSIEFTSPAQGAIVTGSFAALAAAALPGPDHSVIPSHAAIGVRILSAATGRVVVAAPNVDTRRGVRVPSLAPGIYRATWRLIDANGDVRVLRTSFQESGRG